MAASMGNLPGGGGFNPYSYTPSQYRNPNSPPPQQPGGGWKWNVAKGAWDFIKGNAGDILQAGAGLIEGYMSSEDRAKQLAELQRQYDASLKQRQSEFTTSSSQYDRDLAERMAARNQSGTQFERTTGDTEAQAAVRAQTQLNAAPMADKAQALLLSRMGVAPGQFQGRDYTKGTNDLSREAVAPSAGVMSAMQAAAKGYKAGDGGVDTSTIKMLLDKMKASGFKNPAVPTAPTIGEPRLRPPTGTLPPDRQPPISTVPPDAFPPPTRAADAEQDDSDPAGILRRRMTGAM